MIRREALCEKAERDRLNSRDGKDERRVVLYSDRIRDFASDDPLMRCLQDTESHLKVRGKAALINSLQVWQ